MMRTTADALAEAIASAGTRHVFGISGGEVLLLMDALARAGVRFIGTRHETAAGFMAEGTWHAQGTVGVMLGTVGPGATNGVNAVANARQDRVPLLVITGSIDEGERFAYTHQWLDQRALFAPITKASFTLVPEAADEIVARAIALALAHPQGPVHLDVPVGLARAAAPKRPAPSRTPARVGHAALSDVRERLARAERPLVIAGLDALDASAPLRALLDATSAPLITTYKAKGVIDERDARALGAAGLSPSADKLLLPLVQSADVVILAGYDPIEMRRGWIEPFGSDAFVIECTPSHLQHGVHTSTLIAVGDVQETLRAITPSASAASSAWQERALQVRTALRQTFAAGGDFDPRAIAHAIRATWPDEGFVSVDTGAHRIVFNQAFEARVPHRIVQSSGLCTMGCAVPLAIGIAVATDEPVLAVVGDGGLDMVLGELLTARDLNVPLVVVVIDDQSLGLIALKQARDGLPRLGVDLGATRYADVANAMGGHGVRAESQAALKRAILDARTRGGLTVIHCPISKSAYEDVL